MENNNEDLIKRMYQTKIKIKQLFEENILKNDNYSVYEVAYALITGSYELALSMFVGIGYDLDEAIKIIGSLYAEIALLDNKDFKISNKDDNNN